ncbi:hypothetical protein K458DRAFT_407010 [Lentithecium fluviatile CBS 122367]|uniref:Uncharacterized protein n=1 Tax=Lentithecium fluviatile CBS 122367 TaxID=1168545 RepID=A0A6G1IRJ3_9PLEO|nr:hypothetical protein K458DRAFT_407010 [Lentithecium fluviatile CBS 122367]
MWSDLCHGRRRRERASASLEGISDTSPVGSHSSAFPNLCLQAGTFMYSLVATGNYLWIVQTSLSSSMAPKQQREREASPPLPEPNRRGAGPHRNLEAASGTALSLASADAYHDFRVHSRPRRLSSIALLDTHPNQPIHQILIHLKGLSP